jgi:hypothetical protein
MSKDLVEDFDENPTTVSGSGLNPRRLIDARSSQE